MENPITPEAENPNTSGMVSLEDGTYVIIRPIRVSDAPKLQAGFKRLSPRSIRLRFLSDKKELTEEEARSAATVDYMSTMAYVAVIEDGTDDNIVGVARYASNPDHPTEAEAAIIVTDAYQGRGLGKQLMIHLVDYAKKHSIRYFQATVLFGNDRILNFIRKSGLPFEKKLEYGAWEIKVDIGNNH
jgi:acetyltransferase